MTFLFKVKDIFMLTERGLTLVATMEDNKPKFNDSLKIIRPDKSTIETQVRGISFGDPITITAILVGKELTKEDIPIGSEVWLNK